MEWKSNVSPSFICCKHVVLYWCNHCLSTSDPTATPKRPLGRTYTLEAQRQMVEEVTDAPGTLRLKKSHPTWKKRRRKRREATTPTTHPHLLNMSSTVPHSEEATSQTSTRAPSLSLSLNPVLLHLLLAKKSATPN